MEKKYVFQEDDENIQWYNMIMERESLKKGSRGERSES